MARSKTKLICPRCPLVGGTLSMRRAGNGQNYYFYIGHSNASGKKEWCQIKGCNAMDQKGFRDIKFVDPKYPKYLQLLERISRYHWNRLNIGYFYDAEERRLLTEGCKLLHDFGWPARWAYAKFVEDWKDVSQQLQGIPPAPINHLDKKQRQLQKEYRKAINGVRAILATQS